ncbi:family 16 glycosylhydrolase [Sunxiuqinia sp. A32]|uniref:family 16 glycosylhydrolase n=1 Tax=Sunxiuqinia sp. A32 TaxID=3461496 RepID=UPI00404564C0
MKLSTSIILLLLLTLISAQTIAQQNECDKVIWSDEFEVDGAPSSEKWDYDLGGDGWGNNELQTYTNSRSNSWIADGKLYIKAIKSNGSWTSARLVSREKGDWLYGRIEVKAKLPSGKGTWPAIWMLPTDWEYGGWPASGEIDIMEHVGYDPGVVHGTIHTKAYNHGIGTQQGASITVADATTNFHVYAIEWTEEQMRWYVDNQLYFTFNNEHKTYKEWPFDKRFHLLLNIAIGGDWGGAQGIDPNLTQATMEIEYVRISQNKIPTPVIIGSNLNEIGEVQTYQVDPVEGVSYLWHLPDGVNIISGAGTNQITVQWNDIPGDIQLEIRTACDTVFSNEFHVNIAQKPEDDTFPISPLDLSNNLVWQSEASENNSFILDENSEVLNVNYAIQSPLNNPYIYYNFGVAIDFTELHEMSLDLKIDPSNPPSNMRIDLVDINGNVRINDLFKINSFNSDDQFHKYTYTFNEVPDRTYQLDKITQLRVYVNYGILGAPGNSSFQLKNMQMQIPGATAVSNMNSQSSFRIFPNPASSILNIQGDGNLEEIAIYQADGRPVKQLTSVRKKNYQLNISNLSPGTYFVKINNSFSSAVIIY